METSNNPAREVIHSDDQWAALLTQLNNQTTAIEALTKAVNDQSMHTAHGNEILCKMIAEVFHSQSSMLATNLTSMRKLKEVEIAGQADIVKAITESTDRLCHVIADGNIAARKQVTALNDTAHAITQSRIQQHKDAKKIEELITTLQNHHIQSQADAENLVKAIDNLSDYVWTAKQENTKE